jgi:PIN domain nuclease of toxin-antitoxin system
MMALGQQRRGSNVEHALAAGRLSGPYRDPFDWMLIVQAKQLDVSIITIDPGILPVSQLVIPNGIR